MTKIEFVCIMANPLSQVSRFFSESATIKSAEAHWENFKTAIHYPPFIKPAVRADRCELDTEILTKRIFAVAAVALAAIAVSFTLVATCGLSTLIILPWISLIFVIKLDDWLSSKMVDEKSIKEYLEKDKPSASATAWLQKRPKAVQKLIKQKGDLNKVNEDGQRLIEGVINPLYVNEDKRLFEVFEILIDNGVNLNLKDRHQFSSIERIFQSANPQYLKYVIDQKKIPHDLTPEQKFNFWFYLGHHPETKSEEFKKLGLDRHIVNPDGLTPLKKLIQIDPTLTSQNFSRGLPMDAHVAYLVDNSKLLEEIINIRGKQTTLRKFLEYHCKTSEAIRNLCKQIQNLEKTKTQ